MSTIKSETRHIKKNRKKIPKIKILMLIMKSSILDQQLDFTNSKF